jgi:hypothetical protein
LGPSPGLPCRHRQGDSAQGNSISNRPRERLERQQREMPDAGVGDISPATSFCSCLLPCSFTGQAYLVLKKKFWKSQRSYFCGLSQIPPAAPVVGWEASEKSQVWGLGWPHLLGPGLLRQPSCCRRQGEHRGPESLPNATARKLNSRTWHGEPAAGRLCAKPQVGPLLQTLNRGNCCQRGSPTSAPWGRRRSDKKSKNPSTTCLILFL